MPIPGNETYPGSAPMGQNFITVLKAFWPLVLLLLLLPALPARGQYRTSIQGTVTDQQGAVIPGATLTLVNKATNETVVRTSDAVGIFNFNALPADHFTLTVERDGFTKKVLSDLQLIPEQPNALNVKLDVGATSQTVTVNASSKPAMDTETADNGRTITEHEIQHMPVFQRDVTGPHSVGSRSSGGWIAIRAAADLQAPGTQTGASSGGGGNLGNSSIFATENGASANTNGQQFENNGYTVDGISTVSAVWGGSTVITPSEDSISNIKSSPMPTTLKMAASRVRLPKLPPRAEPTISTAAFSAQITRPGIECVSALERTQFIGNGQPEAHALGSVACRDTDRYNQIGGSIGGPIWKNKSLPSSTTRDKT
jgi:hypothetical protein